MIYYTHIDQGVECFGIIVLLCLPSDSVQHELQRWSLKQFPKEKIHGNKGNLLYAQSLTTFNVYFPLSYIYNITPFVVLAPSAFSQGVIFTFFSRNISCRSFHRRRVARSMAAFFPPSRESALKSRVALELVRGGVSSCVCLEVVSTRPTIIEV